MKRLLISHVDLDGFGIIAIAKHFNNKLNFTSIISEDYGFDDVPEKWDFVKTFDEVIIADLSVSKEKTEELRNLGIRVEFYDHHSTADWLAEDEFSSFDINRSGTKIFFEDYVVKRIKRYPAIIEEFVELVNTYDLWKQDSPLWDKAKNLNDVLYGLKDWDIKEGNIESLYKFFDLFEKKVENFDSWKETELEKRIIENATRRENEVYEKAKKMMQIRVDKKGKIFGVITATSKISLVCSRILKEQKNLDYIIAFNTWGGLTGKLSFRSKNDFNCNDIGIANGHDVAAGGQISTEQSFQFLENPKLAFTYNEDFNEEDISTYFEEVEI